MVIEIKKSKSVFITLGIIGLLSVIASILIVAFVEDRQSVPYILMTPAIVLLVVFIYFIVFLISYIKKPYLYLIKFEDDYIELTNDREVFYKDISYVLTDDNDYIKYFVITSHNKLGFYHKSKDVNKFLIDLLKSKDVKVIDSQYKNKVNKCVAKIYWIKQEDGGRRNIPFTNMYAPQIILEEEERSNVVGWSAFVINKESIIDDRTTIADIMLFSEKCPYELKVGVKFKLYEGSRMVATGEVVSEIVSGNYVK